jgi:hypothetical protein
MIEGLRSLGKLHEQVDIRVFALLSPGERPKKSKTQNAVSTNRVGVIAKYLLELLAIVDCVHDPSAKPNRITLPTLVAELRKRALGDKPAGSASRLGTVYARGTKGSVTIANHSHSDADRAKSRLLFAWPIERPCARSICCLNRSFPSGIEKINAVRI